MSITTMKRKSEASRNLSGKSNGGFSLNNPRRVDAHSGENSIQTRMRGLGYIGHGGKNGKYPIRPIKSQYVNDYDPFTGPRASVKNNAGMLSGIMRCCKPVVQQTSALDAQTYIRNLKLALSKPGVCNGSINDNSGKGACNCDKKILEESTYVKPKKMDYNTYYNTVFLNKKGLPLPPEKEHYPPMIARTSSTCSIHGFTYEEFKAMKQAQK